jgi:uncharacterized protein (DUF3084 family)
VERNQWIAERDQLIKQQQLWLKDRDTWIIERDQLIDGLQAQLAQHAIWVRERDQWVSERDQLLKKQEQWISDRERWIAERDTTLEQVRKLNIELINSRAFRLGNALLSPLRLLRRLIPEKRSVRHA